MNIFEWIIAALLIILAVNLCLFVIAAHRSHTYEDRLARRKRDIERLSRTLKGPDLN